MMPWHRTGQTGPAPSDDRVKGKPLFPPLPDDRQAENRKRIHEVLKDFGAHVIQLSLALDGYLTGALSRADAQAEAGEALARFTQIAQSRIKEKMVECDDARMQTAMALSTARQRIAALERENAELRDQVNAMEAAIHPGQIKWHELLARDRGQEVADSVRAIVDRGCGIMPKIDPLEANKPYRIASPVTIAALKCEHKNRNYMRSIYSPNVVGQCQDCGAIL